MVVVLGGGLGSIILGMLGMRGAAAAAGVAGGMYITSIIGQVAGGGRRCWRRRTISGYRHN